MYMENYLLEDAWGVDELDVLVIPGSHYPPPLSPNPLFA